MLQAKGTGRLLHLCLKNSQIFVGETFDDQQRGEILGEQNSDCLLLFPSPIDDTQAQASLDTHTASTHKRRVILLDGTWRKARKMLKLNPWLETLPRLNLPPTDSIYRIRKAQKPGQLSTLEAAFWTMKQAGEEPLALLDVFEQFMSKQSNWQTRHETE